MKLKTIAIIIIIIVLLVLALQYGGIYKLW